MNMLRTLLTLMQSFSLIVHWEMHSIRNATKKTFFPKRLKRNATCEGNAIERSSELSHKSSEVRNKWQFRFRAILCPNPKWRPCFYNKQLSVPIDGSAKQLQQWLKSRSPQATRSATTKAPKYQLEKCKATRAQLKNEPKHSASCKYDI